MIKRCGFCGLNNNEVSLMLAGQFAAICDDCVQDAADILMKKGRAAMKALCDAKTASADTADMQMKAEHSAEQQAFERYRAAKLAFDNDETFDNAMEAKRRWTAFLEASAYTLDRAGGIPF